jgi:hypothetical protein
MPTGEEWRGTGRSVERRKGWRVEPESLKREGKITES